MRSGGGQVVVLTCEGGLQAEPPENLRLSDSREEMEVWQVAARKFSSCEGIGCLPPAVSGFSKGEAGAGEAAGPGAGSDTALASCHCSRKAAAARLRTTSTSCFVRAPPSKAVHASDTAAS